MTKIIYNVTVDCEYDEKTGELVVMGYNSRPTDWKGRSVDQKFADNTLRMLATLLSRAYMEGINTVAD